MFQMSAVTNILIVVVTIGCTTVVCQMEKDDIKLILQLQQQIRELEYQHQNMTARLSQLLGKVNELQTELTSRIGKFNDSV